MAEFIPITGDSIESLDRAEYDQIRGESSFATVAPALMELSVGETGSASIANLASQFFDSDPVIDPDTLNEEFGTDIFNESISRKRAGVIMARKERREHLESIVARGGDGTFDSVFNFGFSMIPQILDPTGWAIGMGAGVGLGVAGSMLTKSAKFKSLHNLGVKLQQASKFGKSGEKLHEVTKTRDVAEGVIGNIIEEGALVIPSQMSDLREINIKDNMTNAIVAGVAFPLIFRGITTSIREAVAISEGKQTLGDVIDRGKSFVKSKQAYFTGKSQKMEESKLHTAMVQADEGKAVNVSEYDKAYARDVSQGTMVEYEHKPMIGLHVKPMTIYMSSKSSNINDFNDLDFSYGAGKQYTDNLNVANGRSAHELNDSIGTIIEAEIQPGSRGFDMDKKLKAGDQEFDMAVDILARDLPVKEIEDAINASDFTMKGIMDRVRELVQVEKLPAETFHDIVDGIKDLGFEYTFHVNRGADQGAGVVPHNIIQVLDDEFVKPVRKIEADATKVGNSAHEAMQNTGKHQLDDKTDLHYDDEAQKAFDETEAEQAPEVDTRTLDEEIEVGFDRAERIMVLANETKGVLPEGATFRIREKITKIKEQLKLANVEKDALDKTTFCLRAERGDI